jgi:hypothetical protein
MCCDPCFPLSQALLVIDGSKFDRADPAGVPDGSGRSSMATSGRGLDGGAGQGAPGKKRLQVLANRSYVARKEILKCEQADVAPLVPGPLTSNAKSRRSL